MRYDDDSGKSIPRSMFSSHSGEMDYFFNAAILTSNTIALQYAGCDERNSRY